MIFDSTKTKKFFAKLLEAIKAFFAKLLSLFGRAKAEPALKTVPEPKILLEIETIIDNLAEPKSEIEPEIELPPEPEPEIIPAPEPMLEAEDSSVHLLIETPYVRKPEHHEAHAPKILEFNILPDGVGEAAPVAEAEPMTETEIDPAPQIETVFKAAFEPIAEATPETAEATSEPTPEIESVSEIIPDSENDSQNQDSEEHLELADDDADNLIVEMPDDDVEPQEILEQTDAPTGNDNAEIAEYNTSELTVESFEPAQKDDIQNINKFDSFLNHLPNLKQVFQNSLTAKPAPDAPEIVEPDASEIVEPDAPEMAAPQVAMAESGAPAIAEPLPESDTNPEIEAMQAIDDSMQALPESSFEAEPEIDTRIDEEEIDAGIDELQIDESQIDDGQALPQTLSSQAAQIEPEPIVPTPAPTEMSAQKMIEDSDNILPPTQMPIPASPISERLENPEPAPTPTVAPATTPIIASDSAPTPATAVEPSLEPAPAPAEGTAIWQEPPAPTPTPESTVVPESATPAATPEIIEPNEGEHVDIMESEETLRKIIPEFFQGVTSEDINKTELDNPYQKFESRLDPNSALPPIPRLKIQTDDDIPAPDSTRVRYFMQTVSAQESKD